MKNSVKKVVLFFVCVSLLCVSLVRAAQDIASPSISENTRSDAVSASFGVAHLDSDGNIQLCDNKVVREVPFGTKIKKLAAGDFLQEGSDQLAFVDSELSKSLYIHSFKTNKTWGPYGSAIQSIATAYPSADENYPSIIASNESGQAFRWNKTIMEKGWISLPETFEQSSAGRLTDNASADDIVAVRAGNVYQWSPKQNTYTPIVTERNIVAALVGKITKPVGAEIVMFDKRGEVFLSQNAKLEDLKARVKVLTVMKNGGDENKLDTLYGVDLDGWVIVYQRESNTWKPLTTSDPPPYTSVITHKDKVYPIAGDNLYVIENGKVQLLSLPFRTIKMQCGEKLIADYKVLNVPFKPYIATLRTPSGRNTIRDAPFDHKHHHGLMFATAINNTNFWEESHPSFGRQLFTRILNTAADKDNTYTLKHELDWWNGKDKTVATETREIVVTATDTVNYLDWTTQLHAPPDQPAHLDKSAHHYYGLGMRFDKSMDVGGTFFYSTRELGQIIRGDERLTPCDWVAYTANLRGEPATVAIFSNPKNPLKSIAFTMGDAGRSFAYMGITLGTDKNPVDIPAGETLTFQYRVAVWDGTISAEEVAKEYQKYLSIFLDKKK